LKKDKSDLFLRARQVGILSTIPFVLVCGPLIGYFAGDWLDHKYGWDPYAKAVLMVVGFAAAAREVVRIIRQAIK